MMKKKYMAAFLVPIGTDKFYVRMDGSLRALTGYPMRLQNI